MGKFHYMISEFLLSPVTIIRKYLSPNKIYYWCLICAAATPLGGAARRADSNSCKLTNNVSKYIDMYYAHNSFHSWSVITVFFFPCGAGGHKGEKTIQDWSCTISWLMRSSDSLEPLSVECDLLSDAPVFLCTRHVAHPCDCHSSFNYVDFTNIILVWRLLAHIKCIQLYGHIAKDIFNFILAINDFISSDWD